MLMGGTSVLTGTAPRHSLNTERPACRGGLCYQCSCWSAGTHFKDHCQEDCSTSSCRLFSSSFL